jgi:hypothetical protein
MGQRLSGDQFWTGADGRKVPADSARLVQLESVILLNYEVGKKIVA